MSNRPIPTAAEVLRTMGDNLGGYLLGWLWVNPVAEGHLNSLVREAILQDRKAWEEALQQARDVLQRLRDWPMTSDGIHFVYPPGTLADIERALSAIGGSQ